jgi:hypothetical protein
MKLNFTKKQYWDLMRAVYLADWVTNAIANKDSEKDTGIVEIEKFVYSHAKDFGLGDFVDEELFPTRELEDHPDIRDRIDAYDEDCFWQELSTKFISRDVARAGIDAVGYGRGEKTNKWIKETQPLYDKWGTEFDEHGIERLEIVTKEKEGK